MTAILSIAASLFFVLLYSLDWGKPKSEEWLSALMLSFFQSVIIIQPFKVSEWLSEWLNEWLSALMLSYF